ncbi:MAG: lipoate--protein ligase [Oscillospiraceae bacterium]
MNKIIISKELDPYFNIAAENQLFLASDEDIHLFLWQNSSSVIVGRNQNLYAECDLGYMAEHQIKQVRRLSGGGAVYHDTGNLNFTFITKAVGGKAEIFLQLVQAAVAKLGIVCEFSGRNDLLYKGEKFSGHAYYIDGINYMYHGTILIDVDGEKLSKALTPSKLKLKSKGISSVQSRVVNLAAIDKSITVQRMIQGFIEVFSHENIEYIDKTNFTAPLEKLLSSHQWLYGQSPSFSIELERKYPIGNVSVYISCRDGNIQEIKINTDSLYIYDFSQCEKELVGMCFDEDKVWCYIKEYLERKQDKL